ncbi:unnamed protein product [Laminaria digitata]
MGRRDFAKMDVTEVRSLGFLRPLLRRRGSARLVCRMRGVGWGGVGWGGVGATDAKLSTESTTMSCLQRLWRVNEEQMRILNALNADPDSDGLDPDDAATCKICMDAIVDILFLPCAHQCTCERCGGGYLGKPCIICRTTVEVVQKVIKRW